MPSNTNFPNVFPSVDTETDAQTALDGSFTINNTSDQTKKIAFSAASVTTATTRTFTVPDYDATLATIGGAETLTNKTFTAPQLGAATATSVKCTANVGTAGTGSTAVEYGDGYSHVTVLTVNTTLPAIAGGAALGVGKLLYTLPAGAQLINASYMSLAVTQTQAHINADTPKVGLGSVIASGAVSVLNGTATFMDLITEQTATNCTGTATVKTATPTTTPFVFITAAVGAKTIYANFAASWAASGDAAALLTGTVTIHWQTLA